MGEGHGGFIDASDGEESFRLNNVVIYRIQRWQNM